MDWKKAWLALFVGGASGFLGGWITKSALVSLALFFGIGYLGYYYQETWRVLKVKVLTPFLLNFLLGLKWVKKYGWDKNPGRHLSWAFFLIGTYFICTFIWFSPLERPNMRGTLDTMIAAVRHMEIGKLLYAPIGQALMLLQQPLWAIVIGMIGLLMMEAIYVGFATLIGMGIEILLINSGKLARVAALSIWLLLQTMRKLRLSMALSALKWAGIIALYLPAIFVPFIIGKALIKFLIAIHCWQRAACGLYGLVGGTIYIKFVPFQFSLLIACGSAIGCGLSCMLAGHLCCKVLSSETVSKLAKARIWPLKPVPSPA